LAGYRRALRERDLEPDDRLVFNAGNSIEDGAKAGVQLLSEQVGATAIQAVNDLVAIGAAAVGITIAFEATLGKRRKFPYLDDYEYAPAVAPAKPDERHP
jgi:hypothetical protein